MKATLLTGLLDDLRPVTEPSIGDHGAASIDIAVVLSSSTRYAQIERMRIRKRQGVLNRLNGLHERISALADDFDHKIEVFDKRTDLSRTGPARDRISVTVDNLALQADDSWTQGFGLGPLLLG